MGLDINVCKVSRKNIGYFRKVNFLIPFFEKRRHMEIENCEDLVIEKEDVKELIRRCKEVLTNHELAEKLLPARAGFFFGNTEYDNSYYEDVYDVLQTFKTILLEFDDLKDNEDIVIYCWW